MDNSSEYSPNEKDLEYFIRVLKSSTEYFPKKREHWTGIMLLTNDDMKRMLSTKFGKDYDNMNNPNQRKLRERIFRELRGET